MNRLSKHCAIGLLASLLAMTAPCGSAGEPVQPSNIRLTTLQGKTLRLADFRGKWVVVNFWAPWCPLCFHEVPALNKLDTRKDVVVIGIAMDYGQDETFVRQAIERSGMRYHAQVLGGSRLDADSPSRQIGAVSFYPTTYVYGPDGRQAEVIAGLLQPSQIQTLIDSQDKQRPAADRAAGAVKRRS